MVKSNNSKRQRNKRNNHSNNLINFSLSLFGCLFLNRAITNDEKWIETDDGPETSAKIVDNIRKTMNNTALVSVPIQAYIIPSVDAHQVISPCNSVDIPLQPSNILQKLFMHMCESSHGFVLPLLECKTRPHFDLLW